MDKNAAFFEAFSPLMMTICFIPLKRSPAFPPSLHAKQKINALFQKDDHSYFMRRTRKVV